MNQPLKILVVRRDRLGDLLMTLPSVLYLRRSFPNSEIDLNCQKTFHELLYRFCSENRVGLVDSCQKTYDAALFLQGSFKECWELITHRVSLRIGLFSRPWSFALLNKGLRQKRSQIDKNEAEFNLELAGVLASALGTATKEDSFQSILPVDEKGREIATRKLLDLGVDTQGKFVVFHPGMRGSALNVSTSGYLQLIETMESRGAKVLLSIGPEKKDQDIKEQLLNHRPDLRVISGLSLVELAEVFRMAETVIAPSTGPLHLAHWVGAKTIGLYSPIRAQHPIRWAPWGGRNKARVLVPQVKCPAQRDCLGDVCEFYPCMDKANWNSLLLSAESG